MRLRRAPSEPHVEETPRAPRIPVTTIHIGRMRFFIKAPLSEIGPKLMGARWLHLKEAGGKDHVYAECTGITLTEWEAEEDWTTYEIVSFKHENP